MPSVSFLKKLFILYWGRVDEQCDNFSEQQRDSAIHIHVSILPQTPLLSSL